VACIGNRNGAERVWWETPIKIYHVEDLGVDGRIILKRLFKKWDGDHEMSAVAKIRDRWWADVNTAMNFCFHKMRGIS
jgi:hypothetical protein